MNFTFTWIMDKLGYMPKIDMQIGKINLEPKVPDLKKPTVKKTVARKAPVKKAK